MSFWKFLWRLWLFDRLFGGHDDGPVSSDGYDSPGYGEPHCGHDDSYDGYGGCYGCGRDCGFDDDFDHDIFDGF